MQKMMRLHQTTEPEPQPTLHQTTEPEPQPTAGPANLAETVVSNKRTKYL